MTWSWQSDRRQMVLIGMLLACYAALGLHAAWTVSVTHDEYWHLPVGLLSWRTGRFDFDTLNPPLIRMVAAAPLLATSAELDRTEPTVDLLTYGDEFVDYGDEFLDAKIERFHRLFTIGRSMIVAFSVLTGVVLAVWSRELFGRGAALLTVLVWTTSPTVLAHGSLVTTDLGAAFFFAATLFALWRFAHKPTWLRAVLFGALLGLAQLAKYTSLVLLPLCVLAWFVVRVGACGVERPRRRLVLLRWLAALIVCGVVWNGGYLGRGSFAAVRSYRLKSAALGELVRTLDWLQPLPVPLPRDYVEGLDRQQTVLEGRHFTYLNGRISETGFPHYYLAALAYKLPHAWQWLLLWAVVFVVAPRGRMRMWRTQVVLLAPVVVVLGMTTVVSMQLGVRYVLPIFPFLALFAGQAARWVEWNQDRLRTAVVVLAAVALPWSLRFHPHHLAYFNELSHGPEGGRVHLIDSNLDWGQDLRGLRAYLDENLTPRLKLAYFGSLPPAKLGIDYQLPLLGMEGGVDGGPEPGLYAVSVNFLQGRPHWVRDPSGRVVPITADEFGYLRKFTPIGRIGYSIDLFQLSEFDVQQWRVGTRRP